ncbi:hypothetical protein EC973_002718 [Apophysomyces ossiformis]|uniref:Uncharacterized protein n=1 Tax=Apophysomyces ossiformis TaxID=679940 RepID=A0A8H7BS43_9FUNG|nr:hypothetical protein EC973_002718 [Apophysomyces ossiformis]
MINIVRQDVSRETVTRRRVNRKLFSAGTSSLLTKLTIDMPISLAETGRIVSSVIERDRQYEQVDLNDLLKGSGKENYVTTFKPVTHGVQHPLSAGPVSENYVKNVHGSESFFVESHKTKLPESLMEQIQRKVHALYHTQALSPTQPKLNSHLSIDWDCPYAMGIFAELDRAWLIVGHQLFIWKYKDGSDLYVYEDQDEIITHVGTARARLGELDVIFYGPSTSDMSEVTKTRFRLFSFLKGVFTSHVEHVLVVSTASRLKVYGVSVGKLPGSDHKERRTQFMLHERKGLSVTTHHARMLHMAGSKSGRIFIIGSDHHLYELNYQKDGNVYMSSLTCHTSPAVMKYLPAALSSVLAIAPEVRIKSIAIDTHWDFLYILTEDSAIEVVYLADPKNAFVSLSKNTNIKDAASVKCPKIAGLTEFNIESLHVIPRIDSRESHLFAVTSTGLRLYFTCLTNDLKLVHVRLPPAAGKLWINSSHKIQRSYYHNGVFMASEREQSAKDSLLVTCQEFHQQHGHDGDVKPLLSESYCVIKSDGKIWDIAEITGPRPKKYYLHEIADEPSTLPRQFMLMTDKGFTTLSKQRPIDMLHKLLQQSKDLNMDTENVNSFIRYYGDIETSALCLSYICTNAHSYLDHALIIKAAVQLYLYCNKRLSPHLEQNQEKHPGLILYLSRCLAPLWENKLFYTKSDFRQIRNLLSVAQTRLDGLRYFIDTTLYAQEPVSLNNDTLESSDDPILDGLYRLVIRSLEAIALLQLVVSPEMAESLLETMSGAITDLTLVDMLTASYGFDLAKSLVNAAIENGAIQNHDVGFVSGYIRTKCPNYFSQIDIAYFQGVECMKAAKHITDEQNKIRALFSSLHAFKKIAYDLSEEDIVSICKEYCSLAYHTGALELAFERIARQERTGGKKIVENSSIGDEILYKHVFSTLKDAYERRPTETSAYEAEVFSKALSYGDEHFHKALYSWYILNDMEDELLKVESNYVLPFLENYEPKADGMDYLWKYHQRRSRYYDASKCLELLAVHLPGIKLNKRMEYVSLAIAEAKCCLADDIHAQEAKKLADNLEHLQKVGTLQIGIHEKLDGEDEETKIASAQLATGFLSADTLLDAYAYRFRLWDESLLLVKMLDRQDWRYVQTIWTGMIDENEELASADNACPFTRLHEKVVSIGRLLYPSIAAFPVYLVAKILHEYSVQHDRANFTRDVLQSIGVPDEVITDAFSCLD